MDTLPTTTNARCIRAPFRASGLARILGLLLLVTCTVARAQAQVAEGDLVYKFTVDGVSHRADAKPVQYALLEMAFVHSCEFIEECGCFKLASSVPLDHAALNDLLGTARHQLSGTVEVSDGTFLQPKATHER
jgi:hypothetical protein